LIWILALRSVGLIDGVMKANKHTEKKDGTTRSFHKNFYYESEGSEFISEKSNETDAPEELMSQFADFEKARGFEKRI
jgi:hypothetical protein